MHLVSQILLFCIAGSVLALEETAIPSSGWMIPPGIAEEAVLSSVDAYPRDADERRHFLRAYTQAFLDFQRHGDHFAKITVKHGNPAAQNGYDTAKKRILDRNGKLWISPAEFGYSQATIEGKYKRSFEVSEFVTTEGTKLHLNLGFLPELPQDTPIRLKTWLSPKDAIGFGHFNQWNQEVIAIEVLEK